MHNIDSNLTPKEIAHYFSQTLEMNEANDDMDKMNPDAFCEMMIDNKIGPYGREFY